MKKILFLLFLLIYPLAIQAGQEDLSLRYLGKAPTSLVGDGTYIIKTTPDRFLSARGINLDGSFRFFRGREEVFPASTLWNSTFFPGGVMYDIRVGRDSIYVMYGVTQATGFMACIKTSMQTRIDLSLSTNSIPLFHKEIQDKNTKYTFYSQRDVPMPVANLDEMKDLLQFPYQQELVLTSPNKTLNKAVAFSQYLLDLGYNGEIILCELFRWLDIWARDLGSGLLPGGLVSGRADMARQSLEYDLRRYALMAPEYCKNSNDPSQGGTSAEIGWTARSCWNYYMFSGDLNVLRKDAEVIRPWVKHWIERDYNEDGLIVDVTEFMDHMLMMVTTNGVSTLATNAMYAASLHYFAKIEQELGNQKEARKLQQLYDKTVDAINTVYWNKEKEYFNNMILWDMVCERSSQTFQSILLKMGATDDVRAKKALDYLKENNWCDYGSITVTPRMNHVPLSNDQNVKVWPWWNLWEVEARFHYGDKEGAYKLLDLAARTIEDEKYPGLIEETLDTEGNSIGGNVFMTAAGNLLEVVAKDLMGVEAVTPGWGKVKVVPAVPNDWKEYTCKVPTPHGYLFIESKEGKLAITVADSHIREIQVSDLDQVIVNGADKKKYTPVVVNERAYNPVSKTPTPPVQGGRTALFYDEEFHSVKPDLDMETIDVEQLGHLSSLPYKKIIIQGNKLPLYTKSGISIKKMLEAYTNKGGTVIFYGATVNPKSDEDGAGILGEQCGIIDWYQYLPARDKIYLRNWTFVPNTTNTSPNQKNGLYSSSFELKSSMKGMELYLELGSLVGLDSVFINNIYVAGYRDMEPLIVQEYPTTTNYSDNHRYKTLSRMYLLKPGTKAYEAIYADQVNTIAVKIYNDGMNVGLPEKNKPNIGVITDAKAWQATDDALPGVGFEHPKRKGVNYWGNEQFFNSWSTKNGLFGFEIDGTGIQFCDHTVLAGMNALDIPVRATYTDFALFKPWTFEVLAYTTTRQHLLYPASEERYPCIIRIVNTKTKGGYILINPSVVDIPVGKIILEKLKVAL